MKRVAILPAVLALIVLPGLPLFGQQRLTPAQERFFESKIRPVLIEHCYDCHSSEVDEPGGGLLVDSREGLLRGGQSGPAIVPGRPRSSLLLIAIQQVDPDLIMPPKDYGEKLPDSVLRDFQQWIEMGAPDPRVTSSRSARSQKSKWDDASNEDWWAWKPPTYQKPPEVDSNWPTHDIDRFVLAELNNHGIEPSPRADLATLVRRLSFDLTGLPPRVEDLQRFALSANPDPLDQYVDQLLESPQFGEHFGRHWLDVARYAESTGKDRNVTYPHAWRYRDYVINSMNEDKPFDRFIREQIAGDLLHATSVEERAWNQIATGFLVIGPKSLTERNPRQFAIDVADEQIDAVSQAFMGVTIACARCHDHKFDPITQRDYTALAGIFLSTKNHFGTIGGNRGINRTDLIRLPDQFLSEADWKRAPTPNEFAAIKQEIREIETRLEEMRQQRLRSGTQQANLQALVYIQRLVLLNTLLEQLDEQGRPLALAMGVSDKEPPRQYELPSFSRARLQGRSAGPFQRRFGGNFPNAGDQPPRFGARRRTDSMDVIMDSPLLIRGELDKPGETVPRGLPEFLLRGYTAKIPQDQSGRLQLAAWIASDRNPLTARVIVNRIWSWMFGEGIVPTEDNFGTSGEPPSNQPLLDYLALHFIENNWSIKTLVREIALSSTYQQASTFRPEPFEIDPNNRLLWRANVRSLSAESLRDGMLMISGQMRWERPSGSLIAEHRDGAIGRPASGLSEELFATYDPPYRSVYLPVPRNALPDALQLFDFPDNSAVRGDRDLTIVPSQALYWLNSEVVDQRCRAIARKLLSGYAQIPQVLIARNSTPNLIQRAGVQYVRSADGRRTAAEMFHTLSLQVLSRPPLPEETAATLEFIADGVQRGESLESIWTSIVRGVFSSADYRFLR